MFNELVIMMNFVILSLWRSIHEFARLRFANSLNDKTLVILTCLCHTLLFLVILNFA